MESNMSFTESQSSRGVGTKNHKICKFKLSQRHKLMMTSILGKGILPSVLLLCSAAQANAQSCTPEILFQSASSFEGRDASGSAGGFDANNIGVGDFIIFEGAVTATYNPAAQIDVVMQITDVNNNSALPPHSADSGNVTINSSGVLTLSRSIARSDPYVTFRLIPMRGGSVTSSVASGTQLSLQDAIVSLQDVDSVNSGSNNSDVAGISTANSDPFTLSLNATEQINFQNGGGPSGFTTYTSEAASTSPVSWAGINGGGNPDHTVDLSYAEYTGGEFLHGFTGSTTNRSSRGGVFALCGTIAPAELTSTKTIDNVVENTDGSTSVTYTITSENTGEQVLTGLTITDDLDTVFSGSYDGFIPSTASVSTGGVTALDSVATILVDTGSPIGTFPTNPSFNGGSDINIFDPSNAVALDPGDRIQVSVTLLVEPNLTGATANFLNEVIVTSTDEFLLPTDGSTTSAPLDIPTLTPSLTLEKPAPTNADEDGSGSVTIGDTLTYTITATNDGDITLNNVVVTDPLLAAPNNTTSCATLAIGATCVLTGTHVVTVAEANAGTIDNTAEVASDEITTPIEASQSTPAVVNPIASSDDSASGINGTDGATGVLNVFDNDTLNGSPVNPADVTLTQTVADPTGALTLNPDGSVDVAPGTPAGTYELTYEVCETANPTNCTTATVSITVEIPQADLSLTKTNTPGVNSEVDQANDTLTSGQTTTYTIVVTNNGPDSVSGAVVTDTPSGDLTCSATNTVTLSGDGVPAGTFTIADLTGAGISLDNLDDGQSTTLTYSCEVN